MKCQHILFATSATIATLAFVQPAVAQESGSNESLFSDEIIVTAQKREQNAQKIGVSVAAVSGDELEALGLSNSSDIAAIVPSVNIQTVGGTDAQLIVNIRGLSQNDFGDHNEAPVAVYVDDAYVSWLGAVGMMSYDIERVEAVRGPQGTLFGRNATGGLLHFLTRKPSSDFDARFGAEASSHNGFRVDGAIGGGIGGGIAARLAGTYERSGDYIDNRAGPDLGEGDRWSMRGQVRFDLGADSDLLLKGEYSRSTGDGSSWTHRAAAPDPSRHGIGRFLADNELFYDPTLIGGPGCPGCDALGYRDSDRDPDTVDLNNPTAYRRNIYNAQAKLTLGLGTASLVAISDYRKINRTFADDSDGGPFTVSAFQQNINSGKQFSQELRLQGQSGPFDWVTGAYYLHINGNYTARLDTTVTGDPALDFIQSDWGLRTTSYALFGQGEYRFSDQVSLVGGMRWTKDKKRFNYANTDGFGGGVLGGGLIFSTATVGALARQSDDSVSYKVGIDWRPAERVLVYANVTRGTKAGGFSASLDGFLAPAEVAYSPESLTSFEAGFKSTIAPGLRLNGSSFYYDYNNYQAFTFIGLTQKIVNLDARIYGAEVELSGQPLPDLDVLIGASWLNTRAHDVPMPDGTSMDRKLPQAPSFSLKGLIRKSFNLGEGRIALQMDASYQSAFNFNIVRHDTTAVDGYAIANTRITYTSPSERWSISAFADNVFDKRVAVSAIDISGILTGGASLRALNRPRWFGAELRFTY